jgi:ribosomal protein S18 acetylase RimI-like enzyme
MNIQLFRIRNSADLLKIKILYEDSFPNNERREFYELEAQILKPENEIYTIARNGKTLGFVSIWNFNDFVFIEHFAIDPECRGQGIGSDAIKLIIGSYSKPFVLEVEPPKDEVSIKRINFYKRLGFKLVDKLYMQPSYDGVKPEVELRLMLTVDNYTDDRLNNCTSLIRSKVYGKL